MASSQRCLKLLNQTDSSKLAYIIYDPIREIKHVTCIMVNKYFTQYFKIEKETILRMCTKYLQHNI